MSDSTALMRLVDAAYGGLPTQRVSPGEPRLKVQLRLARQETIEAHEPPRLEMHGGGDLLCGVMDAHNFAIVSPASRSALVVISRELLRHAYYARYELLEFAVYTLAARVQGLVSLHAACVGEGGKGLLLIGRSGAGKSTLALHGVLAGLGLLSEDSVFVAPRTLLATGIGTFLHVRTDAPRLGTPLDRWIRSSPVIRRRSGTEKFEVDLRHARGRIARTALEITAIVFVSKRPASNHRLLLPLSRRDGLARLKASQAYAAGQSGWSEFARNAARVPVFELRRGDPGMAIGALRAALARNAE